DKSPQQNLMEEAVLSSSTVQKSNSKVKPQRPHKRRGCCKLNPGSCEEERPSLCWEGSQRSGQILELVEKFQLCLECEKGFSQSSGLIQHQRIHMGEWHCKGQECGKSFRWSSDLIKHHKINSGEKPWECPWECGECEKSFGCSSGLRTHLGIPSRERPCECPKGGKSFLCCSSSIPRGRIRIG
ncbi:ZNF16 protein, partial [Anthoscopus minutus]|nr:ZNF16 protein [Anthoscopus minutus]